MSKWCWICSADDDPHKSWNVIENEDENMKSDSVSNVKDFPLSNFVTTK